jgi:hypothetical protein
MGWIFVTAVFLVIVFLSVRYRAFRRGLLITAIGVLALGAVGGVVAYLYDQQEEREQQRLMRLIKDDDLKFERLTLSQSSALSEFWDLKGNVTNLSRHTLERFALRIEVHNCPEDNQCVVVGEDDASAWIEVPPNQMRTFSSLVSLRNLPELENWKWFYSIIEIRAKAAD